MVNQLIQTLSPWQWFALWASILPLAFGAWIFKHNKEKMAEGAFVTSLMAPILAFLSAAVCGVVALVGFGMATWVYFHSRPIR